jgi:DNA-binding MarR family transcriptional regulator
VRIELSAAQVNKIVRAASDGGSMSILFSGLADMRALLAAGPDQLGNPRLSRSLLAGLLMLASFPGDGSYLSITKLARMLDLSPSTTHRYVSTLLAVGLVERDPRTRQYRLADAG